MNKRRRGTRQAAPLGRTLRTRLALFRGTPLIAASFRSMLVATGTLLALVLRSNPASAQAWLPDRQYTEGAGVRLGDFELHPGIMAQGGTTLNWFMRTDKTGYVNSGPEGAFEMRITPSLSLATLGVQRTEEKGGPEGPAVVFRATASATYYEDFGQFSVEQRNASVDVNANLGILPGRPWSGLVTATYDRVIQPTALTTADPDSAFTRDSVGGSAEIGWQPGGGTLDWHLGARGGATLFEDTGGLGYDNYSLAGYMRGRWKFRPRTALVYDATLGYMNYGNVDAGLGTITTLHSSHPRSHAYWHQRSHHSASHAPGSGWVRRQLLHARQQPGGAAVRQSHRQRGA